MKELELIPITRRNSAGEIYRRSSKVETQIREALSLDRKRLLERVNQRDYGSDDYLHPECLVYLIRVFRVKEDLNIADTLTNALIDRCKNKIHKTLKKLLTQYYIDECFEEVIGEIIGQIYDANSDKSNFAEIRFWLWLNGIICNVRRKYFRYQNEDSKADNADDDGNILKDNRINIDEILEKKDGVAKAVSLLTERERQIYVMRYDWKWQISSKDPSVNTISKHFDVTGRAVQKWFNKAEEKLQNGKEG